jgi:hypothetical protein
MSDAPARHASPDAAVRAPRFVRDRKGFEALRPWWWWLAFTVGVAWAFACGALTYLTAAGYPIQ